jgi:hypothetical protein
MNEDFRLPFFDPDYCLKVARWSSAVCIAWLLLELILLVVSPDKASCPNWTIHPGKPSEVSAQFLVLLFTVLPGAWLSFNAIRKRRFSQRIYKSILEHPELNLNYNHLLLVVCVGWALFCSWPLWFMLSNCTGFFR